MKWVNFNNPLAIGLNIGGDDEELMCIEEP